MNDADSAQLKVSVREKKAAFQGSILGWAASNLRDYPWRRANVGPYDILVAEVLLKRTTAAAAARVYEGFLGQFPSVEALASATEGELAQAFSQVGLQWQRAKAMKRLVEHLMAAELGEIPCDLGRLLAIPGLGEYSARAVLSFGCGVPAAVVDANVERVYQRLFQRSFSKRPSQGVLQAFADELLPEHSHSLYNWGILDLGGLVCRYVNPRCAECPLEAVCDYFQSTRPAGKKAVREARAAYQVPMLGLRGVRRLKRFSLARLSRESGVSKLTIINIEAGRTTPRPETLQRLAHALSVSPEELA